MGSYCYPKSIVLLIFYKALQRIRKRVKLADMKKAQRGETWAFFEVL